MGKRPSAKKNNPRRSAQGREAKLSLREYLRLEKDMQRMDFFADLNEKDRAMLMPYMRLYDYPKGTTIFHEGVSGDRFYLIHKGAVEVFKKGTLPGQGHMRLAVLGPGKFFGEMALLFRQPRSATCVAKRASGIFHLTKQDFQRVLRRSPAVLRRVRLVAEKRIRTLTHLWSS